MNENAESPKLLSSIISELQDNNHVNELIFDSVESLNGSLIEKSKISEESSGDFLNKILERVNGIYKNVYNFLSIFTNRDLQQEENRRELLDALKNLGAPRNDTPQNKKEKFSVPSDFLDNIYTKILLGIPVLLAGVVSGFVGTLSSMIMTTLKNTRVYKAISSFINSLTVGFTNFLKNTKIYKAISGFTNTVTTGFMTFFNGIKTFFDGKISSLKNVFGKGKAIGDTITKIKDFFKPIGELFSFIKSSLPSGGGFWSKIMTPLKGLFSIFDETLAIIKPFFGFGKVVGSLLAKAAFPIQVIISAFDTITGAIEGYKKDGIVGALKGGLSGLLNGLVGSLLDMLKSGISWIAGKLGFKNVEKILDSFSFKELITEFVDGLISFGKSMFDILLSPFTTIPKMISDAVSAISSKGLSGIVEFPKIVLKEVLPDPNKHKSGFDPLYWTAKAIPDSIYEYAGIKKPQMADNIVTETASAVQKKNAAVDNASNMQKKLSNTQSYDINKDGSLDDSEFIAQLKDQKSIGSIGNLSLDYSTPEKAKQTDKLLKQSGLISESPIQQLTPQSSIERMPNTTGETLNQSSASALVAPVVVNNYGGNITNNNTSRVNNSQTVFDPIITGSGLNMLSK
jgi:hypothetical protein